MYPKISQKANRNLSNVEFCFSFSAQLLLGRGTTKYPPCFHLAIHLRFFFPDFCLFKVALSPNKEDGPHTSQGLK